MGRAGRSRGGAGLRRRLLVFAAAGVLLSCGRAPEAGPEGTPEPELRREPAALVAALRDAPSRSRAADIVHVMLSISGVHVTGQDGVSAPAEGERIAPMRRHVIQTHAVAREARAGVSRLTLAQMAELLAVVDFPLEEMAREGLAVQLRREAPDGSGESEQDSQGEIDEESDYGDDDYPDHHAQEEEDDDDKLEELDADDLALEREVMTRAAASGQASGVSNPADAGIVKPAGPQLARILHMLVAEARSDPSAPGSVPLLLLDELARLQEPSIDLTGDYHPDDLRWGLLEIDLFLAAFARHAEVRPAHAAVTRPPFSFASTPLRTAAAPSSPDVCSQLLAGADGLGATEWAAGKAGGKLTDRFLPKVSSNKAVGKLGNLNQLLGLAQYYSFTTVHVEVVTPNPTHKVVEGERARKGRFRATVAVDPDMADLLRRVKEEGDPTGVLGLLTDCGGKLGLPVQKGLEALMNEVPSWQVEWEFEADPAGLATWGLSDNKFELVGTPTTKLTPAGRGRGTAELVVEIGEERKDLHEMKGGKQKTGKAVATAKVNSSKPPSFGFLLGGVKAGAKEMAEGMARELVQPKGHASLAVSYHAGGGYVVDHMMGYARIYGVKCGGFQGRWNLAVAGKTAGFIVRDGYLRLDIKEEGPGLFGGEQRLVMRKGGTGLFQMWGQASFDWHKQALTVERVHSSAIFWAYGEVIEAVNPMGRPGDIPVTWSPDACAE